MTQQLPQSANLATHYRAVFTHAWARRHELAGPALLCDEAAFLPAALSLQHTPVHPAPRRAAWAITALFVAALTWACLGSVDIVAVAPGRIIVSEHNKLVQPLERSVVRRILVRDGDKVQAGQALVELDATSARSDGAALLAQARASHSDALRARHMLRATQSPSPESPAPPSFTEAVPETPPGWSAADAQQAQAQVQAEWGDIRARLGRLSAEHDRRQAELVTARQVVAKTETTLPMARQREDDLQLLSRQGFVAGHISQDRTRERIELERDLVTQRARLAEAHAAVAESESSRTAFLAETRRALVERETLANLRYHQLRLEYAKAAQREALTVLVAPVAGVVQQLATHSPGGVVTEAQVLLVIVPDEAPGTQLVAEIKLENKDAGFVAVGQRAEVKLETFPFTRYGTVGATVELVSADAVADDKRAAIFPARLRLHANQLEVDGRRVRLGPGMNLTAEIKTGQQQVISYLLAPLQRTSAESLRER